MSIYLGVVILYLVVVAAISLSKARKAGTHTEYMVDGRRAGTFFMIMTLIATWTGAGSLIGGAGLAYRQGFSELWMSAGAWVAYVGRMPASCRSDGHCFFHCKFFFADAGHKSYA